jgi:hypothetical protein
MAAMDLCGRFGAPRDEERHLWVRDRFRLPLWDRRAGKLVL